jgi:hypothetical protein
MLIFTSRVQPTPVGLGEESILVEQWSHEFEWMSPNRMTFGCSAAIEDLPGLETKQPNAPAEDLEIVTGSDELDGPGPGYWRAFDSHGNVLWTTFTQSDQSRSSPVIVDLNGDGKPEIAGGTTSGHTVEVMTRYGNWFWTFPTPPSPGENEWLSSPAAADLVSGNLDVAGPELAILHRKTGMVFVFDGDNSDWRDNGTSVTGWEGREGRDWDVLWTSHIGGEDSGNEVSTPAIGDVDNDHELEIVIGSGDGNVYVLNGSNGAIEHAFATAGEVPASAALADVNGDGYLEIVIGSTDSSVYCLRWNGVQGAVLWRFQTRDAVYSSAAIGDVDADGGLEVIVGSNDGIVYCLNGASGGLKWFHITGGAVYSSPALADRFRIIKYQKEWPMFRHDATRTGFYGSAHVGSLDVYVGSDDNYLYLLNGVSGALIDRFLTYGPIRSSPSVADTDGDRRLEVLFYDWGNDTAARNDTFWCIEDSNPPAALFQCSPEKPCATETVTFNAFYIDSNVSYEWEFGHGNGTTVTEPAINHTYEMPGKYNVSLKVTDKNGRYDTTSGILTVYYMADLNRDAEVDILDVFPVAIAFGSKPEDLNWNQIADINKDDTVNILDIFAVAWDFGKTV